MTTFLFFTIPTLSIWFMGAAIAYDTRQHRFTRMAERHRPRPLPYESHRLG